MKTAEAARKIAGQGWVNVGRIAEILSVSNKDARSLLQSIERSSYYLTESNRSVDPMQIKVIAINGESVSDKNDKLWRLAIFGEQLA